MPVLEINHLSKYYGRSRGIEDFTLKIDQAEIFGFTGQKRSGKSTTIRILLNLLFSTSGSGKIIRMDMVKDSKKMRKRIVYIPSDANLYDRINVTEFLNYCADFRTVSNSEQKI